jgi:hypothetical protein
MFRMTCANERTRSLPSHFRRSSGVLCSTSTTRCCVALQGRVKWGWDDSMCPDIPNQAPKIKHREKKKRLCNSAMAIKARHVVRIRVVPQTQRIPRRYATRSCDSAPIFTTRKKSLPRFTPFAFHCRVTGGSRRE